MYSKADITARLSPREVGEHLKVGTDHVRKLIYTNKLGARKIGGRHFIGIDDLNRYLNGQPPKENN